MKTEKKSKSAEKDNVNDRSAKFEGKPKSKTRLFWEKYPEGIGSKIIDMSTVLR